MKIIKKKENNVVEKFFPELKRYKNFNFVDCERSDTRRKEKECKKTKKLLKIWRWKFNKTRFFVLISNLHNTYMHTHIRSYKHIPYTHAYTHICIENNCHNKSIAIKLNEIKSNRSRPFKYTPRLAVDIWYGNVRKIPRENGKSQYKHTNTHAHTSIHLFTWTQIIL